MAKVTLDLETFKALASTTRLQVLKALDERRKTLSEISRDLELNKATVHEHLQVLVATGLVKKMDEGRKWIYYELSWQGERLLHPESSTTFSVLLGLSVLAAGGSAALFGQSMGWWWQARSLSQDEGELERAAPPEAETASDEGADSSPTSEPEDGTSNDTAMGAEAPEQDAPSTLPNDGAMDTAWDESGILSILLLLTAALLAFVAFATRRGKAR